MRLAGLSVRHENVEQKGVSLFKRTLWSDKIAKYIANGLIFGKLFLENVIAPDLRRMNVEQKALCAKDSVLSVKRLAIRGFS